MMAASIGISRLSFSSSWYFDSTNVLHVARLFSYNKTAMCDLVALCVLKGVTTLQSEILYHRDIVIIMTFFIPASKYF